jgi:hypothetical protein
MVSILIVRDLETGTLVDKVSLDIEKFNSLNDFNEALSSEDNRLASRYPPTEYGVTHLCGETVEEIRVAYPEYRRFI